MELWDLVDAERHPLGMVHERGTPIPQGCYHVTVHICVFNAESQILIQKRTDDREVFPGLWDISAAGSALTKETSREAAHRETLEEIGLDHDFTYEQAYLTVHGSSFLADWYLVDDDCDLDSLSIQKEEVAEIRWASLDEILAMKRSGKFIPYQNGFLELLASMHQKRGAHL